MRGSFFLWFRSFLPFHWYDISWLYQSFASSACPTIWHSNKAHYMVLSILVCSYSGGIFALNPYWPWTWMKFVAGRNVLCIYIELMSCYPSSWIRKHSTKELDTTKAILCIKNNVKVHTKFQILVAVAKWGISAQIQRVKNAFLS